MPHNRLALVAGISMAAVAAFAAETGSGSGSAADTKASKGKDLVQQAETPPAGELPAEVAEQLRLAAENLEAAQAEVVTLKAEMEAANTEGDDLAREVESLKGDLASQASIIAQLREDLAAAKKAKGAAAVAAAVAARVEHVEVTVRKGAFHHHDAPDGVAREGETFTASVRSQDEADDLQRHSDRGVIALAGSTLAAAD